MVGLLPDAVRALGRLSGDGRADREQRLVHDAVARAGSRNLDVETFRQPRRRRGRRRRPATPTRSWRPAGSRPRRSGSRGRTPACTVGGQDVVPSSVERHRAPRHAARAAARRCPRRSRSSTGGCWHAAAAAPRRRVERRRLRPRAADHEDGSGYDITVGTVTTATVNGQTVHSADVTVEPRSGGRAPTSACCSSSTRLGAADPDAYSFSATPLHGRLDDRLVPCPACPAGNVPRPGAGRRRREPARGRRGTSYARPVLTLP